MSETTNNSVPQNVQALVREHVSTFEELLILLWMHKSRRQLWSAHQLQSQLCLSNGGAEALLALNKAGLIMAATADLDPYYRYAPGSLQLARAVSRLQRLYKTRPIAIMQLMSENSIHRVRDSAMRAFADAFLVGRSKTSG